MDGLLSMLLAMVLISSHDVRAQTLARPGWAGSGYTVEPWWKGAVFYEVDPLTFPTVKGDSTGDLGDVASRLDYLQALGVNAIVLPPPGLNVAGAAGRSPYLRPGSEEEFSLLIGEAMRRKIRVIVDLPLSADRSDEELACTARFLLSRGAAALRLTPDPRAGTTPLSVSERSERLRALRVLCGGNGSTRVLLWDLPEASSAEVAAGDISFVVRRPGARQRSQHHTLRGSPHPIRSSPRHAEAVAAHSAGPQMAVDRRLSLLSLGSADEVHGALEAFARESKRVGAEPVLANYNRDRLGSYPASVAQDRTGIRDPALAKVLAAVLLTTRGSVLLRAGQELGLQAVTIVAGKNSFDEQVVAEDGAQDSLLNWYRKLNLLRRDHAALHDGTMEILSTSNPDVVAWLRRARVGGATSQTVIVLCNLSPHANWLSLRGELQRLGVGVGDGRFHRLLSSPATEEASSIDSLDLAADGVYVGELRSQRGLETVTLPSRRSRRRSR